MSTPPDPQPSAARAGGAPLPDARVRGAIDDDAGMVRRVGAEKPTSGTRRRVLGWTDAARRGCAALDRPGDRACEEQLLRDAATYSIAKEGHEGVIISVGAPVSVAVDPNARRSGAE